MVATVSHSRTRFVMVLWDSCDIDTSNPFSNQCLVWLGPNGEICVCLLGFPGGTCGKEPVCQGRRCKRHGFAPWVQEDPLQEEGMEPTPVFLPGESHGERSLVGYSP